MGGAVGVERVKSLRQTSHAPHTNHIYSQAAHALAHRGRYGVIDQRDFTRLYQLVEKIIVHRINLFANYIELALKYWYVASISTTSIAEAYSINVKDVCKILVSKRDYGVYKCGTEVQDVPSQTKAAQVLELQDPDVIQFMLYKCRWTRWQPPTSWRVRVDHVFDVTVHVAIRQEGFLTGEFRVVRLRVGRKWVGAHFLSKNMANSMKCKWLHRVDFEVGDQVQIAASAFFKTVEGAWEEYVAGLAKLPQKTFVNDVGIEKAILYDEQGKRMSLRIKYLLDTALENIISDRRTLFWLPHQYELWRMEQEDTLKDGQSGGVFQIFGPSLRTLSKKQSVVYEEKDMGVEEVDVPRS